MRSMNITIRIMIGLHTGGLHMVGLDRIIEKSIKIKVGRSCERVIVLQLRILPRTAAVVETRDLGYRI